MSYAEKDYEDNKDYEDDRKHYPNHMTPWNIYQDTILRRRVMEGKSVFSIASELGRYPSAIASRMEKLRLQAACSKLQVKVTEQKEAMNNLHYLITMLQKDYTTVKVSFDQKKSKISDDGPLYTYKAPTSMGLEMDDLVVVFAQEAYKVARVVKVDEEPEIDPKMPYQLKWVVDCVKTADYHEQVAREKSAIEMLLKNERKAAQEAALKQLLEVMPDRAALELLLNGPREG